jgi:hypothetical protein
MSSSSYDEFEELLKLSAIAAQYPNWNASFVPPGLNDPNYVPPYNGQGVLPLAIILLVGMISIVSLRFYARGYLRTSVWGWDDWCIIPATLISTAINVIAIIEYTKLGLGHHAYDLSWYQLSTLYKLIFAHYILYLWAAIFIRLSLILFYLRLLSNTTGPMVIFIRCFMVYLVVLTVVAHFATIFAYSPVSAGYDLNVRLKPFKALNTWLIVTWLSSIYAVTDVITWLLPIQIIWKLKLSARRRLSLFLLFGLGGIVCCVVVLRTTLLKRLYSTWDITWGAGSVSLCTIIECDVGIIIASLPALNALLSKAYHSSVSSIKARWNTLFGYSKDRSKPSATTPSDPLGTTLVMTEKSYGETRHGWADGHLEAATALSKEESLYEIEIEDGLSHETTEIPHRDGGNFLFSAQTASEARSTNSSNFSVDLVIQQTHGLPAKKSKAPASSRTHNPYLNP